MARPDWMPTDSGGFVAELIVQASGPRLYGAMIVLLEAMTHTDPDVYEHAKSILNDTCGLKAVLREMEAGRRAREQAKIAANAAVPVAPALVAELEKIDRLVVEELRLELPLPLWAELQTSRDTKTVTFFGAGRARPSRRAVPVLGAGRWMARRDRAG